MDLKRKREDNDKSGPGMKIKKYREMAQVGRTEAEIRQSELTLAHKIMTRSGLTKVMWNTIRGIPAWKRKAAVLLKGAPGSGKTLIQTVMTQSLKVGFIDTLNLNFPLSHCRNVDVIVWEEASMSFQLADTYKKVMEGRGYLINIKGKEGVVQNEWTPIVITTNQTQFPKMIGTIDKRAIKERMYEVELGGISWLTRGGFDQVTELADISLRNVANIIDLEWHNYGDAKTFGKNNSSSGNGSSDRMGAGSIKQIQHETVTADVSGCNSGTS